MGWNGGTVALLAVMLLLAVPVAGQLPDRAPAVTFEDVQAEGLVEPGGATSQVQVPATIGCETGEVPETTTNVVFGAQLPAGASVGWAQANISWTTEPGDCLDPEETTAVNGTALVSAGKSLAAFQPVAVPLALVVVKTPPAGEANQYGPYNATLTFTPGYVGEVEAAAANDTVAASPDGAATWEVDVDNLSNGETRIEVNALTDSSPAWLEVTADPTELVLAAGQSEAVTVTATPTDPQAAGGQTTQVPLEVTGASTDERGGQAPGVRVNLVAQFEAAEDEGGVPGPGLAALLVVLAAAAASRRR